MNPRYVEDQPDTVPTDHGDLGPSKAEYRRAAEAATDLGADAQHQGPEGGGIVRAVIAGLVVFFVVACVLLALRANP